MRFVNSTFIDIEIVDLDIRKTTWSRVHSSMRTLYLKLSREPDVGWTRFFFEERASRVELKRHGLWIEEGYIIFDCLLDEVDSHHLPDIRESVAYANGKCHELVAMWHAEGELERAQAQQEQRLLGALRRSIRGVVVGESVLPEPSSIPEVHASAPTQEEALIAPIAMTSVPAEMPFEQIDAAQPGHAQDASHRVPTSPAAPEPPPIDNPAADSADEDALLADFNARRKDWRTRFRDALALASRKKEEPERGNH